MTETPALDGVRVVELAQGISGPYCAWLMACAGAEVVKVEPREGDFLRGHEPAAPSGAGAAFVAINSGKSSVVLPEGEQGEAALAELLAGADVVIVDDTADGTPFDDDWLQGHIPAGAVVCRTAPTRTGLPATELEVQAMSGLNRYLGTVTESPVRIGADLGHVLSGAFLFQGALASLLERDASGRGQQVTTTALGALAAVGSVMIAAVDDPDEWEGFHCRAAAYPPDPGVQTATGPISFSAPRRSDDDWRALCREFGADALAKNPDYAHDTGRTPRSKELNRELSEHTSGLPRSDVLDAAVRHGALAVPVQQYDEVFHHPQTAAIDALSKTPHGSRLGPPWRINGERPHPASDLPGVGEHSDAVLGSQARTTCEDHGEELNNPRGEARDNA